MNSLKTVPLCPPNAAMVGYTFVRHIGFILDELSSQGLDLWRDEHQRWQWRWVGTRFQSERGFWALGEALVDAVVTRYSSVFAPTWMRWMREAPIRFIQHYRQAGSSVGKVFKNPSVTTWIASITASRETRPR